MGIWTGFPSVISSFVKVRKMTLKTRSTPVPCQHDSCENLVFRRHASKQTHISKKKKTISCPSAMSRSISPGPRESGHKHRPGHRAGVFRHGTVKHHRKSLLKYHTCPTHRSKTLKKKSGDAVVALQNTADDANVLYLENRCCRHESEFVWHWYLTFVGCQRIDRFLIDTFFFFILSNERLQTTPLGPTVVGYSTQRTYSFRGGVSRFA